MSEYKLTLPLFTGGKTRQRKDGSWTKPTKKFWLNLNNYRNWHYQTLNKTKVDFKKEVTAEISKLPDLTALWGVVSIRYVIFPKTRARMDLGNPLSVIDKYFCDALSEAGKLTDDNYKFVRLGGCDFGGVDKDNPRMEAYITPYKPANSQISKESTPMDTTVYTPRKVTPQNAATLPADFDPTKRISFMQVTLSEEELIQATQNYIKAQLPIQDGDPMPVSFNAGRGDNGHTAIVTIQSATITVKSPERPVAHAEASYSAAKEAADSRNQQVADEEAAESSETPSEEDNPGGINDPKPETKVEEPEAPETSDPVEGMTDIAEENIPPAVVQEQAKAAEVTEEPKVDPETQALSEIQDVRDEPAQVAAPNTRKASSLFGTPEPEAPAATQNKMPKGNIFNNM